MVKSKRRTILGGSVLLVLAAMYLAPPEDGDLHLEVVQSLNRKPKGGIFSGSKEENHAQTGVTGEKKERPLIRPPVRNPFSVNVVSTLQPLEVTSEVIKQVEPEVIVEPSFPFTFLGVAKGREGKWYAQLGNGEEYYTVSRDEIVGGDFKVDEISELELRILRLSDNKLIRIPFLSDGRL